MNIFQAIVLGIVQGLTEFLPISSSAHLYLIPYLFRWEYQGLGFDVALHWGTLLGVLAIFWRDYWRYTKGFCRILTSKRDLEDLDQRMAWYLAVGSVPAAVVGFLARDLVEQVFRNPIISVITLAGFGVVLLLSDRVGKKVYNFDHLDSGKAFLIGVGQALALVPGVSRSGATITAGLFLHLSRAEAARFAFLLSGPAIFGAGLISFPDLAEITAALVSGFAAAAISGFVAIRFMLRYLASRGFGIFVWYRMALAAAILVTILIRG